MDANIAHRPHDARTFHAPARSRDRRRYQRIPARGLASHIQTKEVSVPGLSVENISVGGMFVRSARPLDLGTPVTLQVVRPGLKRAIQARGRVVSVVTPAEARDRQVVAGMGIALDLVDHDAQARLRALIDDLAGLAPAPRAAAAPSAVAQPVVAPVPAPEPPAAPAPAARAEATAIEGTQIALTLAKDAIAGQAQRIEKLEAELRTLKAELLKRNRTIGDLARRLSAHEEL